MTNAEKLFTQTFSSCNSRFTVISSFRRVAELGLPEATPKVHLEWLDFAQQLFHDPQNDKFFIDKQAVVEASGGVEDLGAKMAQNQINGFRAAMDAASLVFAHSIIDNAAFDYCRVIAIHSPREWEKFIEQKKITISDLKERTHDELVEEKVNEFVKSLGRESLLFKIDKIFQICHPDANFSPLEDYKYDRDRLDNLDEMRHDVIHGSGPVKSLPNGASDIWFMQQTANYLMALVNMRFGIKMNPQFFLEGISNSKVEI